MRATILACAVLALLPAAASANAAGRLDPSFGRGGVVHRDLGTLGFFSDLLVARTIDALDSQVRVVRLGPTGRPDARYLAAQKGYPLSTSPRRYLETVGGGGLARLPGGRRAVAAAVVADGPFDRYDGMAVDVIRKGGWPDLDFNNGSARALPLGDLPLDGLVVDERGGLLVAGGTTTDVRIARVRQSGRLDMFFGVDGIATVPVERGESGRLVLAAGRPVAVAAAAGDRAAVVAAAIAPRAVSTVGLPGRSGPVWIRGASVSGHGIVVLGTDASGAPWVLRLTPRLRPDRGFGGGGIAALPRSWAPTTVAVASGGRVLLGGLRDGVLGLMALDRRGRTDRSFGIRGAVTIRRGVATEYGYHSVSAQALAVDGRARTATLAGAESTHIPPTCQSEDPHCYLDDEDDPPPVPIFARFLLR